MITSCQGGEMLIFSLYNDHLFPDQWSSLAKVVKSYIHYTMIISCLTVSCEGGEMPRRQWRRPLHPRFLFSPQSADLQPNNR